MNRNKDRWRNEGLNKLIKLPLEYYFDLSVWEGEKKDLLTLINIIINYII